MSPPPRQPRHSQFARPFRGQQPRRNSVRASGSADVAHHVYGLHAISAAFANPRRTRHRLLATQNALARLEGLGAAIDVEVEQVDAGRLTRLLGADAVHQGCLLYCAPLPGLEISEISPRRRLVVLDQVTDPHNVGAILRSAAAFGADALIVTDRHSPQESAVLAKSAAGALDIVPMIRVRNLSKALEELLAEGTVTIGLDGNADHDLEELNFAEPFALVMGAEGKGLRQKTRLTCSALGRLHLPGAMPSLNVSNAAALALYVADRKTRPA